MPTSSYDLVVLGDDFAGLVAGTLCARRGMRVLVLTSTRRTDSYQLGPFRLPTAPLPLVGTGGPAVRRVLEELALDHPVKRRLRSEPASYQLVGPDTRVDVVADEKGLGRDLERELIDPGPMLDACDGASSVAQHFAPYLSQDIAVPPTGFWERREVARNATRIEEDAASWAAHLEDHPLTRSLIELPAMAGGHLDPRWLTAPSRARLFDVWRQGAPRLRGDWDALRELFSDKLIHHNGEIRAGRPASIGFSWGKVNEIRLEHDEIIGTGHVIAALPVDELLALVEHKQPKRLVQAAEGVLPAGYRYTLNVVMDEAGVPEGMASTVLCVLDPDQPLIGDNAFAVYVGDPDDEARVVVSIQAISTPRQDDADLQDGFARLRKQLRERLETLMPFYEQHVLAVHSPNEPADVQNLEHELGLPEPLPAEPVWHSDLEPVLGVSAVPYTVGPKNLSIASSQVLPGLGLEGLFTAGWCAAKLASASTKKKRDYLKNEVIAGAR